MMVYLLLPRGSLDWDDLRLLTSFAHLEQLLSPTTYGLAFEGTDELMPVWLYQLERGQVRRYPISPSLSGSSPLPR